MLVMTYSDARKNFAAILDKSKIDGAVIIKRADGSQFRLSPEPITSSPFANVKSVAKLRHGELSAALEDSRNSVNTRF